MWLLPLGLVLSIQRLQIEAACSSAPHRFMYKSTLKSNDKSPVQPPPIPLKPATLMAAAVATSAAAMDPGRPHKQLARHCHRRRCYSGCCYHGADALVVAAAGAAVGVSAAQERWSDSHQGTRALLPVRVGAAVGQEVEHRVGPPPPPCRTCPGSGFARRRR